jgi:putative DNA primase/helicase
MNDILPILTTINGERLAKVIHADGEVEGYGSGMEYRPDWLDVRSLDDIEAALWRLSTDVHSCVIRGELRDEARRLSVVNRCQHVQADGRRPHWDHARPGRRWVAFDIDKMPSVPPEVLDEPYLAGLAEQAREMLPEPFASTGCVYKLSSSAGLDGWQTASMHLWFWLDRPVFDLSWRAWAEGVKVDSSLFKSVQPHYTADPVFEAGADPLRGFRIGRLPGIADVVEVPDGLDDWAGWDRKAKAALEARKAELAEAKARIIGAPEQSPSATRKYALQALDGMVTDVLAAGIGERHGTLVTKAYKLGGYVQDGFLCEAEAIDAMTACVHAVFPAKRHRDELRAVAEMVAAGMKAPLDLSHIGRKPKLSLVGGSVGNAALKVEPLAEPTPKKTVRSGGPQWVDLSEKGKPLKTALNLQRLIEWLGVGVRWNLMAHEPFWTGSQFENIALECRNAAVASKILDEATRLNWSIDERFFHRSVSALQADNAFHPVSEWVTSKPWDGVSRFDAVMATLEIQPKYERFRELFRAQLRAWLVSGGKCLLLKSSSTDGVEVQGVLVLQGKQGAGKTRWLKSLLPESSWIATGVKLDPAEKDAIRKATSTFIVELGELDSTTRKADVALLKAFLTESKDIYRTPYGRGHETFVRRTIYGASVNPDDFLKDPTGNRRFWPMPVTVTRPITDIDTQQVWAEAMHYAGKGEQWWLTDEMMQLHEELVCGFAERSPWADEFFAKFTVPVDGDKGTPWKVRDIRHEMMGEYYKWTDADMKRFTQFLKTVVPVYESKGVTVARLNRISG